MDSYDLDHKCLTPESIYSSSISDDTVSFSIKLPFVLDIDEKAAVELEAAMHYAIEGVLALYFSRKA